MSHTNATVLATLVDALKRCKSMRDGAQDAETIAHWNDMIDAQLARIDAVMLTAPRGSGIDRGTTLDMERSSAESLVLTCSYHHMDDHGYYDGWTDHTVRVRATLAFGLSVRISGPNRNGIKDYLHDTYFHWLTDESVLEYPYARKACTDRELTR